MPVGLVPPESVAVSEMLFPTVVSVDALVVRAGVMRTLPGLVTLFVDKVTAAVTDMRRPVTVAPLARVIAVLARMFPVKSLPAGIVTPVPT